MRYSGALRPGEGQTSVLELGLHCQCRSHNFVRLTRMELVPWRRRPASQRRWVPLPFNPPTSTLIGKMLPGARCPCNWGNTACEAPLPAGWGARRGRNRGPKASLTCCLLYYICAAATSLHREEEVLRVSPRDERRAEAEPMYPAKHSVLSIHLPLSHTHTLTLPKPRCSW